VTEAEWLAETDPEKMLKFLRFKCGVRKVRLLTAACHRQKWHHLNEQSSKAVEAAEELANNRAAIAAKGLREAKMDADAAAYAAWREVGSSPAPDTQVGLLRDVFGNPFRPATIAPTWQTPTVVTLSQAAYDNRTLPAGTLDPARLAVLADALEEADCTDGDLLGHLRGPGPHVRGCWAVDLLLGKE
jgi:hypothetical protein